MIVKLTKISKITGKIGEELFGDFKQMEKRLSKISTSYYELYNYSVSSNDFESLVKHFKEVYNHKYYTVDTLMESISLNKLSVGDKRKLAYKGSKITKEEAFYRAIGRLQRKYGFSYDKDLGTLVLVDGENKIIFDINEEDIIIDKIFINEVDLIKIKEFLSVVSFIQKYFKDLRKRYVKKDNSENE